MVEDGLGDGKIQVSTLGFTVLILVVVEDGLGGYSVQLVNLNLIDSLHPCCGGRWSRRCR